jgi:hypothetical protein
MMGGGITKRKVTDFPIAAPLYHHHLKILSDREKADWTDSSCL